MPIGAIGTLARAAGANLIRDGICDRNEQLAALKIRFSEVWIPNRSYWESVYIDIAQASANAETKLQNRINAYEEYEMAASKQAGVDVELVRDAAAGRWSEIVSTLGVDRGYLDGRHGPCPKCGGNDRFRVFDDFAFSGGAICNQCFRERNGDGFAVVGWLKECDFPTSIKIVADILGFKTQKINTSKVQDESFTWTDGIENQQQTLVQTAQPTVSPIEQLDEEMRDRGYHRPISLHRFVTERFDTDFIVENCLAQGASCIVAGASKAMKTTLSLHLALAIASGGKFLGRWQAKQMPVLFASSESGLAVIQRNLFGMARASQIDLLDAELGEMMGFQDWVPKLSDERLLAYFKSILDWQFFGEPAVLVLDPLYLCLDGETQANLSLNAEQIMKISDLCRKMSVTLIVDDHVKRSSTNAQTYQSLQLEDITGAGKAEFFRQWILLGRRSKFQPDEATTRNHELWMSIGGSAGHGGTYGLDIAETVTDDCKKIDYEFTVANQSKIIESAKAERKSNRNSARESEFAGLATKLLRWMETRQPTTVSDVKSKLRVNADKARQLISHLIDENKIRSHDQVQRGKNWCDAWVWAAGETELF